MSASTRTTARRTGQKALSATLAGAVLVGSLGTLSVGLAAPAMAAGKMGPAASNDEWAGPLNTALTADPLVNDDLPKGYDQLKIPSYDMSEWGAKTETPWGLIEVVNGNNLRFTPEKDFSGHIVASYRVYNKAGDYIEQRFRFNTLPSTEGTVGILKDDKITANGTKSVTINVLANDEAAAGMQLGEPFIGPDQSLYYRTFSDDKATYVLDDLGELTVTPKSTDPGGTVDLQVAVQSFPNGDDNWDEKWERRGASISTVTIDFGESGDFSDNPPGANFYQPIKWMQENGLTTGYADGSFGPGKKISRAEVASFLYRMADPADYSAPVESPFKDVSTKSGHYKAITWMEYNDIVGGYKDGSFKPGKSITRGEMAKIIFGVAAKEGYTPTPGVGFSDVAADHNFAKEITWLKDKGIVDGYKGGGFRPGQEISRGEVAKILRNVDPFLEGAF